MARILSLEGRASRHVNVPCAGGPSLRASQLQRGALRQPTRQHIHRLRAAEGGKEPDPPKASPPSTTDQQEAALAGSANLQLPKDVIERMRTTVFGYDTLFVRGVENYQGEGVLFRGNLRGDPSAAHAKMKARLKEELGDAYRIYLMEERDGTPVAVVLPGAVVDAGLAGPAPAVEAALAAGLAAATLATTLNIFGAGLFDAALLTVGPLDPAAISAALPGTAALLAILAAHEAGHIVAASRRGISLAPPLLLPAGLGLLGSLGAVTRIRSLVPSRQALAEVALAGPAAGAAASAAVLLAGLALTAAGQGGLEVDVASFKESLAVGALGRAALGGSLFAADSVNASPLLVAGWAGLIFNSINLLPAGELDGGRLFLGLFGRPAAKAMGTVTLPLLAVTGFSNSLALFWLLLILTLQRGPVPPCEDELSGLTPATRGAAITALLLPLLVLAPFPGQ